MRSLNPVLTTFRWILYLKTYIQIKLKIDFRSFGDRPVDRDRQVDTPALDPKNSPTTDIV